MGQIRTAPLLLPGSYGLNTRDAVSADQVLRFASLCSNGVIDSSGKLVSRQDFIRQTTGFTGVVETVFNHRLDNGQEVMLSAADGRIYSGIATLTERFNYQSGSQIVDVGGNKTGTSSTGLPNDGVAALATITVDGTPISISIVRSAAQTYTNLIAELNADLGAAATASLYAGNIRIVSNSTGSSSTVSIVDGSPAIFSALTGFVAIRGSISGTAATAGSQVINVGGSKVAADPTGLANDSTVYTANIKVDGINYPITVVGSAAQTYGALITELNADLGTNATASLTGGNILITSATKSATSSVQVTGGTLFAGTLPTGFVGINPATAGTAANDNWQFATLNARIYMAQAGQQFTCLNESTYAVEAIQSQPWTHSPNVVIAAYGRIWVADDAQGGNRHTIWWSDLLDGKKFTGGDAGQISLKKAWPQGQDRIVGLAAAFGRLIVFGRNSILMYSLPSDNNPADMSLASTITNVGCIARDSIVVTDEGVYFLSDNGVYRVDSLANVTSLLSLPQMSSLVNDDVVKTYASETAIRVRAGYYPAEGWYVLNAPVANRCYVFHTRNKVSPPTAPQIQVPAVTTWTNNGMPFRGFAYDKDGNWYCAGTNGVFKYGGYTPDSAKSTYTFDYYSQWLNFGDEGRLKHLKYIVLTLETASGQTGTFRWRTDYKDDSTQTASFTCSAVEFAENPGIGEAKAYIGRSCNTAKFGFTMPMNGARIAFHQLKLFSQVGKTTFR